MAKALLVGNDINNATSSYSWNDLIDGLLAYSKMNKAIQNKNKPFPFLYEEIYLKSYPLYQTHENKFKKYIASETRKLEANELHAQILDLGINDILTTNYDSLFECTAGLTYKDCMNQGIIKENLYSMFRHHIIGKQKIWHIHGSENNPQSITLGYEHYSGYLQQMRSYVTIGMKGIYTQKDFLPLRRKLKEQQHVGKHESWIDLFFTHDLFIFGLNLDFVEMHLWWLLNYRARARMEKRFPVNNTIRYFYPEHLKELSLHKLQMFESLHVEVIPVKVTASGKLGYYKKIIRKIEGYK